MDPLTVQKTILKVTQGDVTEAISRSSTGAAWREVQRQVNDAVAGFGDSPRANPLNEALSTALWLGPL